MENLNFYIYIFLNFSWEYRLIHLKRNAKMNRKRLFESCDNNKFKRKFSLQVRQNLTLTFISAVTSIHTVQLYRSNFYYTTKDFTVQCV